MFLVFRVYRLDVTIGNMFFVEIRGKRLGLGIERGDIYNNNNITLLYINRRYRTVLRLGLRIVYILGVGERKHNASNNMYIL